MKLIIHIFVALFLVTASATPAAACIATKSEVAAPKPLEQMTKKQEWGWVIVGVGFTLVGLLLSGTLSWIFLIVGLLISCYVLAVKYL
jgi:hypothetical protein